MCCSHGRAVVVSMHVLLTWQRMIVCIPNFRMVHRGSRLYQLEERAKLDAVVVAEDTNTGAYLYVLVVTIEYKAVAMDCYRQ
jgi:hypothetical protein